MEKRMKKALAWGLGVFLVLTMLPAGIVCAEGTVHQVNSAAQLVTALDGALTGETIKLLDDIDYDGGIVITDKSITFDLNGFELNVNNPNPAGIGLGVSGALGIVHIIDTEPDSAFNVAGAYGVYVDLGGKATVTNASSTVAGGFGAAAVGGGKITIRGSATGHVCGAQATGENSSIKVTGDAIAIGTGGTGASATDGGKVKVGGSATGSAFGAAAFGANSIVEVTGDAIATGGASGIGASAVSGGEVKINGGITTANVYIKLGSEIFNEEEYDETFPDAFYYVYTDGTNTVRVKISTFICSIEDKEYPVLKAALMATLTGDTIKLLDNIDYASGIVIAGKSVTFDLNGFELNVNNPDGYGLEVGAGGAVSIEDTSVSGVGEFNVTANGEEQHGVYAHDGGQVTVTNAGAIGVEGVAAYAEDEDSSITVTGDATAAGADSVGARALGGGEVIIGGSVTAEGMGVGASGADSMVTVSGSVTVVGEGGIGAMAVEGGEIIIDGSVAAEVYGACAAGANSMVTVSGSVTAAGEEGIGAMAVEGGEIIIGGSVTAMGTDGIGVWAQLGGTVEVNGNASANITDGLGAWAEDGGEIVIGGAITAASYIKLGTVAIVQDSYDGISSKVGYLQYSDLSDNIVWVWGGDIRIGDVSYPGLGEALAAAGAGAETTIKLFRDINYTGGIVISDKAVTFDLNGFELNANNPAGHGLDVSGALGIVDIIDTTPGSAFNVTGNGDHKCGVYAYDGGQATVTNAAATGVGAVAAYAEGEGSHITVTGDAAATFGAKAQNGGTVDVRGNTEGVICGAFADGEDSLITVTGDVTSQDEEGSGAYATDGGTIEITGNATATGEGSVGAFAMGAGSSITVMGDATAVGDGSIGARAMDGGTVEVAGNAQGTASDEAPAAGVVAISRGFVAVMGDVTAVGSESFGAAASSGGIVEVGGDAEGGAFGVLAMDPSEGGQVSQVRIHGNVTATIVGGVGAAAVEGGEITIDGIITAYIYIEIGSEEKAIGNREATTTKPGYYTYSDGLSTVWVKTPPPPPSYDDEPPSPGIVVTTERRDEKVATRTEITGSVSGSGASASADGLVMAALLNRATQTGGTSENDRIEININAPQNVGGLNLTMAGTGFSNLANGTDASLSIASPFITITFDGTAVDAIAGAAKGQNVSVSAALVDKSTLTDEQRAVVGDRPVYDFDLMAGGTQMSSFGGGNAYIGIPYTPGPGEDVNAVVVHFVDDAGTLQTVRGAYNAQTGTVGFTTKHFSVYTIGYNKVSFADVAADAWYKDAVTFIAARGITTGIGDNLYGPEQTITRGQFLVMLMRAYIIAPDVNLAENFSDAGDTYYTSYLAAAKHLGIAQGIGDNQYAPDAEITRQDMFMLLYRALGTIGELPASRTGNSLVGYSDAGEVSDYATAAMKVFVESGVVSGSAGKLDPQDISTRAQMAQVLYNLLSK